MIAPGMVVESARKLFKNPVQLSCRIEATAGIDKPGVNRLYKCGGLDTARELRKGAKMACLPTRPPYRALYPNFFRL